MRHNRHKNLLGVARSHRKSLMRNLAISLIEHGKINTTHAKCKAMQPFVEKLVTIAKSDSVANRRLAYAKLNSKVAVKGLFEAVAPKFKERNGGYTRIIKLAETRVGDGSHMSIISFVE